MTDLGGYTLPQLKKLEARITKEIDKRTADSKASLIKRLRQLARDEGLTLEELLSAAPSTAAARGPKPSAGRATVLPTAKVPLPAKYRNPNDLNQSWSGRGRRPAWFDAFLRNGGTLDALENAAARYNKKDQRRAATIASMNTQPAPDAEAPQASVQVADHQPTMPVPE